MVNEFVQLSLDTYHKMKTAKEIVDNPDKWVQVGDSRFHFFMSKDKAMEELQGQVEALAARCVELEFQIKKLT